MSSLEADARAIHALLHEAGPGGTVFFTGAGISTESGVPDFRGPQGLWTQNAPITYQDFMRDPAMRRESWKRGLNTYAAIVAAQPNAAHCAIVSWWQSGLVLGVVTQNIDGLHQRAGLPDSAVVELHGNSHWVRCLDCGDLCRRSEVEDRVRAGEEEPLCRHCGGILKTTTVSFGQPMPIEAMDRARALMAQARLCVVVGSSLVVYPAAALPSETLDAGGKVAIVNASETDLDPHATFISRHPAAVVLGRAATMSAQY